MESNLLDDVLQDWGDKVNLEAINYLNSYGKNNTGKLKKSIQSQSLNGQLVFRMQDYGISVDTGRNGTERKRNAGSMFGLPGGPSWPPVNSIKKWVKTKPITPSNGITVDQLTYLIGRKIYKKGIDPTLFFTRPFEENFNELLDNITKEVSSIIDLGIK